MVEKRIHAIATALAAAGGATAHVEYRRGYPPTINHSAETDFAASIARKVAGDTRVDVNAPPTMGSEDFSFMLEARPGAFIFIGNGDSATLHHPSYDFNDEVLPYGMSYWVELVETALAP
jgi:hippurate hydrolase